MAITTHEPAAPKRPTRGIAVRLAVIGMLLALFLLSWLQYTSERNAITSLPDAERRAFYERTLHTVRTTCDRPSDGLTSYCAEQADLIVQFPECDETCQKLALSRKELQMR